MEQVVSLPKSRQSHQDAKDAGSCKAVPLWCGMICVMQVPLDLN